MFTSIVWPLHQLTRCEDRIAGAVSEINSLKDAFNHGNLPLNEFTDIHAVCDVVKSWLRVLPDPVFPSSLYHEAIEIMSVLSHRRFFENLTLCP